MKKIIQHCLSLVEPQFRLDLHHGWHGIEHWARVWRNGREIAEAIGVDATVPCYFAFLHDSQRFDEGSDMDHGPRACEWIERLVFDGRLNISLPNARLLLEAIHGHSNGQTDAHPIVQVCWDADRLDLGRVGTMPDPFYLCTDHAKKPEIIRQAWNRSIGAVSTELT